MYSYEIVGLVLLGFISFTVTLAVITNIPKEKDGDRYNDVQRECRK